jgi:hypothetical protein
MKYLRFYTMKRNIFTTGIFVAFYIFGLHQTLAQSWSSQNSLAQLDNVSFADANNTLAMGSINLKAPHNTLTSLSVHSVSTILAATVPDAPTNLIITPLNNGGMIHFTAPANDGGSAISNYEYSTDNGSTWITPSPAISASPLIIGSGLSNCTSYQVKLRAVNAIGSGAESAAVTGTPSSSIDPGINWTSRNSATENNWQSITYGNGLFVAVATTGTGDRVMTSADGINWTTRTSAADNEWRSVTYGNGLFVAIAFSGTGNRVMTSPDGINWISRTSAADNVWQSVTYGNNLFVAVASSGSGNRVMTSPDGINWTLRTSAADNYWFSVTYGNGLFVAVATESGVGNRVMTSPDGITWTTRASAANNNWASVTFGNGLFVAVAYSGSGNRVMTSPNGINWTSSTSAPDYNWGSVTFGNGLFVAVAATTCSGPQLPGAPPCSDNGVMISPDGINWTSKVSAANNTWQTVTYGNGMFVAVASSGTGNRVMTSSFSLVPDGPVITAVNFIDNNSANLSFTQTLSSLAPAVTNYQYSTNNGANWTNLSPASTASPITVTGLTSSTQIQLRAINSVGNSCPAIKTLVSPNLIRISTNNLEFYVDAGNTNSYSGSGTTWNDISSTANNSTLYNGVTYNSANGGSLQFSGSSYSQTNAGVASSLQNGYTLIQAIKLTGYEGGMFQYNGGGANYLNFYMGGSDKMRWETYSGNAINSTNPIPLNAWVIVAGTFSGVSSEGSTGTAKIYVNGMLDGTGTLASQVSMPATPMIIGEYAGNMQGSVGATIFYNRELTFTEIQDNYNAFASRYQLSPINNGSSTTITACSNTNFNYHPMSDVLGTTFSWSRAVVAGVSNTSATGIGDINEILVNTTSNPVPVTYIFTLTANGCSKTESISFLVNPEGYSCTGVLKWGITRNGQKTQNNGLQLDKNGNNTNTVNPINENGKINQ